jgi:hypothetical protein
MELAAELQRIYDGEINVSINWGLGRSDELKLSALQKRILVMALANRIKEGRTAASKGADLYYSEVLAVVYGFRPTGPLRYGDHYGEHAGQRIPGDQKFDREIIGRARYNSAHTAISRAMLGLADHGLITWLTGANSSWSGCSLTTEGLAVSQTVNTLQSASGSAPG